MHFQWSFSQFIFIRKSRFQDKNDIDKLTMTQDIELPDGGFSPECRNLLEALLKKDVHERLGCRGRGYFFCFTSIL